MYNVHCTLLESIHTDRKCVARLMQHPTRSRQAQPNEALGGAQAVAQHAKMERKKEKRVEEQGIDPCTSDMQSQRSTI